MVVIMKTLHKPNFGCIGGSFRVRLGTNKLQKCSASGIWNNESVTGSTTFADVSTLISIIFLVQVLQ